MGILGTDVSKLIKWAVLGIAVIGIILFLVNWRDQGNQITQLESDLKETKEDLKAAEDQLKEKDRVTLASDKAEDTRGGRLESNTDAFDDITSRLNQAVLDAQQEEITDSSIPNEPANLETIPLQELSNTVPSSKPKPPAPTPVEKRISEESINAAWEGYCQAVTPKPEGCL